MLTVVAAYTIPTMLYTGETVFSSEPGIKARRERAVAGILEQVREHLRDHPSSLAFHLVEGDPTGALVNLSQQARTVAVGGAVSLAGSGSLGG